MVAIFDLQGRLFQIEARVPRSGSEFERQIFLKIAFRTTIGRSQNDLRLLLADAG
jgi:hypothetical protein